MTATAIERFLAAIASRRALLGGSLAALVLAVTAGDDRDTAAHRRNQRQHHRRQHRRRGRNRGGGSLGGNDDCIVCEDLDDGPDCTFTSIQAGIDDAQDKGSTEVVVCPGTYKERITIAPLGPSNLTVMARSSLPGNTTVDAEGDGSAVTVERGVFVTFEGFTITGGKANFGGGVFNRGTLTIRNCVVTDNDTGLTAGGGGGIYNDAGHLTLSLTTVSDNKASGGQGGGVFNAGGALALQEQTRVTQNAAGQGGGVFNGAGGTVTIDSISSVTDNTPNNCVGTAACGA